MTDPVLAYAQRRREQREAQAAQKAAREAGPVIIVPSPADVALGYRFIVPDESELPRNAKSMLAALRRGGWWAYANTTTALHPPVPATEKRAGKPWRPVTSYGVHAFTSYPPGEGDVGLVAYWTDDGRREWGAPKGETRFAWARKASYYDSASGIGWRSESLGWAGVAELMKGVTA